MKYSLPSCLTLAINHTPGRGGGYSHTLPIRVCATQRGRDFEAPDLERGNYPFQRHFLERGIKNCGSRLYFCLKLWLIMKRHLFDI